MGTAACVALACPAGAQRFRTAAARANATWQEAATVAQATDSLPFLDSAAVLEVAGVLVRARQAVPSLVAATAEGQFWAADVFVDDPVADRIQGRGRPLREGSFYERWLLGTTGEPGLDSLNARFAADSLVLWRGSSPGDRVNPVLRVVFRYAMNLPAVLAAYESIPGVRAATARTDVGVQSGHTYHLQRGAGGWRLRVDQGIGPCAAGCASLVRWQLAVPAGGGAARVISRDSVSVR